MNAVHYQGDLVDRQRNQWIGLYEKKPPSHDNHAADCQVCGKRMDSRNDSSIPCYELVKMPDGTNV